MTAPDETILVVQEGLGQVVIFSAADPWRRTVIGVGDKPHEIELAPDGRTAYVTNFGLLEGNHKNGIPGTTISVLDTGRGVESARYGLPSGFRAPHGLKLRPLEHEELFTNCEEGNEGMVVLDRKSGIVVRTFPLPPGVHNFIFNADGSDLFAFTLTGEVLRIDPDGGNVLSRVRTGSPRGLAWTADTRHLIVSGVNEILLLDPVRLTTMKRMGSLGVGQTFYPAATPDGRWILVPAVLDGLVLVVDASNGEVARRVETGSPLMLAIGRDGRKAWVSNVLIPAGMFGPDFKPRDGGVVTLDLTAFQATAVPALPDANGLAIARAA